MEEKGQGQHEDARCYQNEENKDANEETLMGNANEETLTGNANEETLMKKR